MIGIIWPGSEESEGFSLSVNKLYRNLMLSQHNSVTQNVMEGCPSGKELDCGKALKCGFVNFLVMACLGPMDEELGYEAFEEAMDWITEFQLKYTEVDDAGFDSKD